MSYYAIDKKDGKWKPLLQIALENKQVTFYHTQNENRKLEKQFKENKMSGDQLNGYTDTSASTTNAAKDDTVSNTKYIPNTVGEDPVISHKVGSSQDGNPITPDIPVTNTNIDPFLGIIASVLMMGGGILVGKGYLNSDALASIVTLVMSLGCTAYVAYKGTNKSKINSLAKTMDVPKAALARHIVALKHKGQ